ncbi:Leucine-rich repeat and death domain-containing protein 1 [Schistosoma japonicum]|nr:Leucine-rich repeat and death domain-containing protein 1 [Schistosoma japonicum]
MFAAMRICSKVLVLECGTSHRSRYKPKKCVLSLCEEKGDYVVHITHCFSNTNQKYKISANIEVLFTSHIEEGSMTIRLKSPPKDIMIHQAESSDLMMLTKILNLIISGKNVPSRILSSRSTNELRKASQRRLVINKREDYPFCQGFSISLQEVIAKGLRLRQFDTRLLKLSSLRFLDLSANLLEIIPQEIQDLNVVHFCLSSNHIKKWPSISESSSLAKTLEILDLGGNELVWLPDDFWLLTNLRIVNLSNNGLRGVPVAFLHKLHRLCVLILNDNQLDSLPSILPSLRLNQLVVYNNPFLPSDVSVKPSGVVPTLLSCASSSLLRSNWYLRLENILPWNLRIALGVLRTCLCCRLRCGVNPYRILLSYKSWLNISCDRQNPPNILTYLCSDKCLTLFNSHTWKYTLD